MTISIPYGAIKRNLKIISVKQIIYISIPYGAIKRIIVDRIKGILDIISIPYGAIKRILESDNPTLIIRFQFLMVRLKGRCYKKP